MVFVGKHYKTIFELFISSMKYQRIYFGERTAQNAASTKGKPTRGRGFKLFGQIVEKDTSLIQNAHGSLVPVCSVCFVHTLVFFCLFRV